MASGVTSALLYLPSPFPVKDILTMGYVAALHRCYSINTRKSAGKANPANFISAATRFAAHFLFHPLIDV
jgi:hypothetical protein